MLKRYHGTLWVDRIDGNKVKERITENVQFVCNGENLKDALYTIAICGVSEFGHDVMIGISEISCENKHIDWNYKNRVIYNDQILRDIMWC